MKPRKAVHRRPPSLVGSQELQLAMCIPLKVAWADPFFEYRYVSFKTLLGGGLKRSYILWILLIKGQ